MKIKNIAYLGIAGLCISSLTGCIEETVPMSDMVVEEQVQQSSTATESMALGMPAGVIDVWTKDSHAMFGYPAIMIQRDVQTGDYMFFGEMGYCHFTAWQQNKARSGNYLNTQFTWNFYYGFLLNINQVVGAVNPENSTDARRVIWVPLWDSAPCVTLIWLVCTSSSPLRCSLMEKMQMVTW